MMGLINWLIFLYIRLRLWLENRCKTKQNRFDVYILNPNITNPEINGMLSAPDEWRLATPNSKRSENILLVGSNTCGSGIRLQMKWRPNDELKLSTLITQFTLECGRNKPNYEYEEVWTQSQDFQDFEEGQYIRKYSGKNITLEVLAPYFRYRLFFSGYMRDSKTSKLVFVRFRSIIAISGKIYDFKEEYDQGFMARQLALNLPNSGYHKVLHQLALQDRHEHPVQFRCVYTLDKSEGRKDSAASLEHEEEKLFCWGFHSRHFIYKGSNEKIRCKRILGHFSNGITFHLGVIESIENKFDPKQRMEFGFGCLGNQISYPIQRLEQLNWDQVTSDTRQLEFRFKCNNIDLEVTPSDDIAVDGQQEYGFIDLIVKGKKGRGLILINDCMESRDDLRLVEESVTTFVDQVYQKQRMIDLTYLEMKSRERQFDKMHPLVVSLNQEDCQFSSLCGAKAASLAQLLHYQMKIISEQDSSFAFKVPNGVVLTRYAFDSILELNPELRQEEQHLASIVCQGKQDQIRYESERVRRIFSPSSANSDVLGITHIKMPQQLLDELEKLMLVTFGMDTINDTSKSFAVRSSSWGEDEDNMSAAGQLSTLLSIRGFNQLCNSIMICYGSKYSMTNLEYKRQHGLPIDMPMAIVIQEMVECDKAGVMFTCNPINGDERELLITANYGLGESVVSAAADPDSIVVGVKLNDFEPNNMLNRLADHIQQVTVGKKKVIMTSESIMHKQNEEHHLLDSDQQPTMIETHLENHNGSQGVTKCCLEDEEIFKLATCGLKLAHYFRCPRDIEWGVKQGQLYLFQSRPITGLNAMNDFELLHEFSSGLVAEREWLSRANIGEVLPFAIRPLTMSYALRSWFLYSFYRCSKTGMFPRDQVFAQRTGETLFISYFFFFSLRMSSMFFFGSGKDRPLAARSLEIAYFGHEVNMPELTQAAQELQVPRPWASRLLFEYHCLPYRLFPMWMADKARKRLRTFRRDILKHKFVKTSSMEDLYKQLNIIVSKGVDAWIAHIMIIVVAPQYSHILTSILVKHINDPAKLFACSSKLLSSCQDVISAGVPQMIEQMGKAIGTDEQSINRFLAMDDKEALKYITTDPNSKLTKLFNKFMDEFGHRSYNEFELVSKPWRDDPVFVINMIKKASRDQLDKLQGSSTLHSTSSPQKASAMLKEMGVELSLADRLYLDYYILPKCRQFLRVRERTKDSIIYFSDCIRDAVNMLAKELRQNCRIPDDDLLCYMSFDEVSRIVQRHEPSIVDQAQRRRRFIKTLDNWKFDEIVDGYDFQPRHLIIDSEATKVEKERMKLVPKIRGTPASFGKVRGPVCIVNTYDELDKVKHGDILVTYSTDIAFSPIFPIIAGIITEIGGTISHGAVIAREYGIPSLIGVENASFILQENELIELDATCGTIHRLDLSS